MKQWSKYGGSRDQGQGIEGINEKNYTTCLNNHDL